MHEERLNLWVKIDLVLQSLSALATTSEERCCWRKAVLAQGCADHRITEDLHDELGRLSVVPAGRYPGDRA